MGSLPEKKNVLLVGSGGVGTMGAYALETGGRATVTAILRSNYAAVEKNGFSIDSIDHGKGIKGWKPTTSKLVEYPSLYLKLTRFCSQTDGSGRLQGRLEAVRLHCCHHQERPRCSPNRVRHHRARSDSGPYSHCTRTEWTQHREAPRVEIS